MPSQIHQDGAAGGRGIACDCGFQFFLGYDTPETIGAKKQIIGILQGHSLFSAFYSHFHSRAQSGGQDVALRMLLCIFGADNATFNQAANVGVIASQA